MGVVNIDKLPPKWKWAKLGEVCNIISGKRQNNVVNPKGKYPIYGSSGVFGYADDYLCNEGSTVIGRKGTINSPLFVNTKFWNVDTAFGLSTNQHFNNKLLYYFCLGFNFHALDRSTTIPSLAKRDLLSIVIPVPPQNVQKQIVSKIEELFSELDKGIEELKKTQQQLKIYRQAVLKWAFEGRLTNKYIIDGILPSEWEVKELKDIGRIETGTTPSKANAEYYSNDYPFFKPSDLKAGINTRLAVDNLSKKGIKKARYLNANSILITCIGATIGKTGLIRVDGACNQQINSITPNAGVLSEYVYYQVISQKFQDAIKENAAATTLPILNKSKFEKLKLILAPFPEQLSIVNAIETRISVCDKIEDIIINTLQQAEALKQSILKKAFEGKILK